MLLMRGLFDWARYFKLSPVSST